MGAKNLAGIAATKIFQLLRSAAGRRDGHTFSLRFVGFLPGAALAVSVPRSFKTVGRNSMLKKIVCFVLAGLLINTISVSAAYAVSKEERRARFTERVRTGIARLGTGTDARVEVRLVDKTKLKGYLSEVTEEHFVVADAKTGVATRVLYPQVKQVKGQNLSSGERIAVSVALAAALLIAVFLIAGAIGD
jgi:hypothetical protein